MEAGHPGQIEPPLSVPPADPQGERQRRGWLKIAAGIVVLLGGLIGGGLLIRSGVEDLRPPYGKCEYGSSWNAKEGVCVSPRQSR